ncbi:MAG: 2-dehydro-3-deoxy-D-gluconate 5-dehydrogenase KduD [Hyphomonadaceae bacterium]|nr:2-dehydro-3-deoxy-D-gluconate 5-dehydrogenase KduD [Hyphomonadaceae bacterium]
MNSLFSLEGEAALVTGADRGLGQAIAVALASAGADIAAVGRSRPYDTKAKVEAHGRKFLWVEADLSTTEPIPRILRDAESAFGAVSILVNNAGIIRRADAIDFSEADWDAVLDTNLKSLFFLTQAVAKPMLGRGRGKIIHVASMTSFQGGIRIASYTAAKSGVAGLTRLLANEWAAKGVNVNAIAPGYFATDNTAALRADEMRNRDILARIPAMRWGEPDDLAGAAIFLASRASDYVHGAILPIDGGWLAR